MYELSVACKYLIPRWRQLSVSIISLVSMLVIALVVWLIVVFFSVKDGLESSWVDKLIALTAPVRVTPTEKYYRSHYYLADSVSAASDYTLKSIGEKLHIAVADPYNPEVDEELPSSWPAPVLDEHGTSIDLVKKVADAFHAIPGLRAPKISDYEMSVANVRLRLLRSGAKSDISLGPPGQTQQFMEQASYVGSFDADSKAIASALAPISADDYNNLLHMQAVSSDNVQEEAPDAVHRLESAPLRERLQAYFSAITVSELRTPPQGWRLPNALWPTDGQFAGLGVLRNGNIVRVILPTTKESAAQLARQLLDHNILTAPVELFFNQRELTVKRGDQAEEATVSAQPPLYLAGNSTLTATLIEPSLAQAAKPADIRFHVSVKVQGTTLQGNVSLGTLEVAQASPRHDGMALFAVPNQSQTGIVMPSSALFGESILLPRSFRDGGALVGDTGFISYYSPTPSTVQEQRVPVYVAGFYDPGIIPIGGKYVLTSHALIATIRSSQNQDDAHHSNGLNLRFDNIEEAPRVKEALSAALAAEGLAPYWQIETYKEYEFTKDIIQQLHSEKNLFSLISIIIILVACSNIISMLIILVNDKKVEIGILRSMGASSLSIAIIFGFCGIVMGTVGSVIGVSAALLTLYNLDFLVGWLSRIQGHDLFNPVFFGETLPNQISYDALALVIVTTAAISLLAGIVPAVKASLLRPSAILRSE